MQATASPLAEQGPHHSGPFAAVAHDLRRRGLCVIPTPGDDGKTPEGGYAFKIWKHPPGEKFVDEMIRAHGNDNLGIITGLSKFKPTVVDVDDEDERLQLDMVRRFGDTPLATLTPSGGMHLRYRFNGERSVNLRTSEKIPVEIKTASSRVVVLVPPSYRRSTGEPYLFVQGTWDDLQRLPTIKPGGGPVAGRAATPQGPANAAHGRPRGRAQRYPDALPGQPPCPPPHRGRHRSRSDRDRQALQRHLLRPARSRRQGGQDCPANLALQAGRPDLGTWR